ncbi:uncharacterized protein N7473_004048 [Penicillium subrubescens]|uniref:uncharacterized protein n=1 Tax=Penicillium subrubescens TaxID=1316194 RepID=UPI002544EBC6|nr:uncharacterized protein N7473_004048 [Penicillium subrubescens]KAJ5907132.1 hypothetical protein N7473_004048 [Penicillium subrubescens]
MSRKLIFPTLWIFLGLSAARPASTLMADASSANTKYLITLYRRLLFHNRLQHSRKLSLSYKPSRQSRASRPDIRLRLNCIGFLTSQYNTSLTFSFNFTVGGATTDSNIVPPWNFSVPSLIDQVKLFSNSIASKPLSAPWDSCNTLAGNNDLGGSYARSDLDTLLLRIMYSYFGQLQILYNTRIRYFILLAIPPMEKTPVVMERGSEAIAQETAAIEKYNNLLAAAASGAPNATCINWGGTACLWRDAYHPGVAIQNLTAQHVQSELDGWFER